MLCCDTSSPAQTCLAKYAVDVPIAQHYLDHLPMVIHADHLPPAQRDAYQRAIPAVLKGWAEGCMKKIMSLTSEKYGSLLELARDPKKCPEVLKHTEAASTFQERVFGKCDDYMRTFPSATAFHVNSYLVAADCDIDLLLIEMHEQDPDMCQQIFDRAMKLGELMSARWRLRLQGDKQTIIERMKAFVAAAKKRKETRARKLAALTRLSSEWSYSTRSLAAEIKRLSEPGAEPAASCGAKDPVSFCVVRLQMYHLVHNLHEQEELRHVFYPRWPNRSIAYRTHNGTNLSLETLTQHVKQCAKVLAKRLAKERRSAAVTTGKTTSNKRKADKLASTSNLPVVLATTCAAAVLDSIDAGEDVSQHSTYERNNGVQNDGYADR
eukprot:SAG31_NODE_10260_length_1163_cov_2.071429_1_plen_379_part_01